jgi:hypothetical protein
MPRAKTVKNGKPISTRSRRVRTKHKILAAYELGLNLLMVPYNVRYYSRFPRDPRAANGRGLDNCFDWFQDAVCRLANELPNNVTSQLIVQASHLRTSVSHSRLSVPGISHGMSDDFMTTSEKKSLRALVLKCGSLLEKTPRLLPWFRLGKSMALCFCNLLYEQRARVLQALPMLVRCAKRLPKHLIEETTILRRLASAQPKQTTCDPNTILNKVLRKQRSILDREAPNVAAIYNVDELHQRIGNELLQLQDIPSVKISFDNPGQPIVELDNVGYPVSDNQACFLQAIIRGRGRYVSSSKIKSVHPLLESANIGREFQCLQSPIKELIRCRKGHHGGFRWIG